MALTKISEGGVKDDAASQAKIADEAIDEARLQVSNAGTNGQFLQKQSSNTGGLTWATAVSAINDDDITQAKIADDAVDEARLQISNAGTNGQYLQKQSGNTGGLTWADVSANGIGNHFTAVAEGAILANKPVYLSRTNGKVTQPSESTSVLSTALAGQATNHGHSDSRNEGFCSIGGDYFWFGFKNGNAGDDVYGRLGVYNTNNDTFSFSGSALVGGTSSSSEFITPVYDSTADRFMIVWRYGDNSLDYIVGNRSDTSLSYGSQGDFSPYQASDGQPVSINGTFDPDNRGCCWIWQEESTRYTRVRAAQISTSGNSATIGSVVTIENSSSMANHGGCDIVYDTNTDRYLAAFSYRAGDNDWRLKFRVGNPSSATSITWGSALEINNGTDEIIVPKLAFDPDSNLVLCVICNKTDSKILQYPLRITGGSTNTVALADSNSPTEILNNKSGNYGLVYDTLADKMIFTYRDSDDSNYPAAKLGTYSENYSGSNDYYTWSSSTRLATSAVANVGDSPAPGSDATQTPLVVKPGGGRAVMYWHAGSSGGQWTGIIKTTETTHNLTGHDYVGFPDAAYSDGQTVNVKTEGNVQSGFSGLTPMGSVYGDTQNNVGTASSGSALGYQNLGKALGSDKIHIKVPYQ